MEDKKISKEIKKIKKLFKPSLIAIICQTLIYLGPPLHLALDLAEGKTYRLKMTSLISVLTLALMIYTWYQYGKQRKWYKQYEARLTTMLYHAITEEESPITDELREISELPDKEVARRIDLLLDKME